MAVTLAQAALASENTLQRGVIETFILLSVIFDRIPFMEIEGNAFAYNLEETLPGVEFRAVNAAYAESTGTINQLFEKLVILGGDADVDRFIQQTRSNVNNQRAIQTKMKIKAAIFKFQDAFINGDVAVDPNGFDGLKKRLVNNQVISAGTNGLPIVGNGNSDGHAFLDKVDELLAACPGADVIYTNTAIINKTESSLRRLNGNVEKVGTKKELVYKGVRILDIGYRGDKTPIIPMTESQGTANNTGSMYAVRFGEDDSDGAVTGLTNGGIQVDDLGQLQEKPALRTRIEWYTGLGLFGGQAAARLKGIKAE